MTVYVLIDNTDAPYVPSIVRGVYATSEAAAMARDERIERECTRLGLPSNADKYTINAFEVKS